MTTDQLDDSLLSRLQRLPRLTPPDARVERLRTRCHGAMARRQLRLERSTRRARCFRSALEPALIGGLSLIYLSAVLLDVLRLHGLK